MVVGSAMRLKGRCGPTPSGSAVRSDSFTVQVGSDTLETGCRYLSICPRNAWHDDLFRLLTDGKAYANYASKLALGAPRNDGLGRAPELLASLRGAMRTKSRLPRISSLAPAMSVLSEPTV